MNQIDETSPAYREVQRVRETWPWIVGISLAGLIWYAAIAQVLLHRPFGNSPLPDAPLVVFYLIIGIGLPALLLFSRLITEVRGDGIYIRYVPFHRSFRRIPFKDLKRCEVRTYRPLVEYGGWGIRFGLKGKAYNVSGNRGVQLELANGKRLLIGSQRPEELWQAIRAKSGKESKDGSNHTGVRATN